MDNRRLKPSITFMLKSKFCLLFIAYFKRVISKSCEKFIYLLMAKFLQKRIDSANLQYYFLTFS